MILVETSFPLKTFGILILACFTHGCSGSREDPSIKEAKQLIENAVSEPTLQYGDLRKTNYSIWKDRKGYAVCGSFNVKNKFGVYDPIRHFAVFDGVGPIFDLESERFLVSIRTKSFLDPSTYEAQSKLMTKYSVACEGAVSNLATTQTEKADFAEQRKYYLDQLQDKKNTELADQKFMKQADEVMREGQAELDAALNKSP
jgi:uncharacterized protein YunC (DUF1805 family)